MLLLFTGGVAVLRTESVVEGTQWGIPLGARGALQRVREGSFSSDHTNYDDTDRHFVAPQQHQHLHAMLQQGWMDSWALGAAWSSSSRNQCEEVASCDG